MLGGKKIKTTGIVLLICFCWFTLFAETGFASQQNEEDTLLKARRFYQEGDYEKSITVLSSFIAKLKAIVAQKKNVSEAFYLLAKVYYTVGEDQKVEENLRKVYQTYPAFNRPEEDLNFKKMSDRIQQEVKSSLKSDVQEQPETEVTPQNKAQVIAAPAKKKKKKFPVLLVLGGVAVVALLAVLLSGGKKDEEKEKVGRVTWVRIQANLTFAGENLITTERVFINDESKLTQVLRLTQPYNDDHVWDDFQKVPAEFTFKIPVGDFIIRQEVGPAYSRVFPLQDIWCGSTRYELQIVEYGFEGGTDPGLPTLSENMFNMSCAPWSSSDPDDEWYRIEEKVITIGGRGVVSGNVSAPSACRAGATRR